MNFATLSNCMKLYKMSSTLFIYSKKKKLILFVAFREVECEWRCSLHGM
jgi:hypothetical protein